MTESLGDETLAAIRTSYPFTGGLCAPEGEDANDAFDHVALLLPEVDRLRDRETELAAQVADLQAEIVAREVHAQDQDEVNADLTGALDDIHNRDRADFAALADAVEQLHHVAHGRLGIRVCPYQPCAGLHRILPNALGRLIAT